MSPSVRVEAVLGLRAFDATANMPTLWATDKF